MKTCVYCREDSAEQFKSVEHVIPQSFGKFGSQTPTLKCVCDECNKYFMRELDQVLARDTLEGITRYKKGIFSRETRRQKGLTLTLAENEGLGELAGALIYGIDGQTGLLMGPVPQFHIFNKQTEKYEMYPLEEIQHIEITEEKYGGTGAGERQMRIIGASREAYDTVSAELKRLGIPYREKDFFGSPFGDSEEESKKIQVEINIQGTIDDSRKRPIVKVLFNFATHVLGADEVLKDEWEAARQFVRFEGETINGRMAQNEPFWGPETANMRYADDSYNIRLENKNGHVVGVVQFFNLFTYEFVLAPNYAIPADKEVAYRLTPGQEPVRGAKLTWEQARALGLG